MKFRGYVALGFLCLGLLLSDLIQRTVVALWVKLRPSRRIPVLTGWISLMARLTTRPLIVLGGARIQLPPRIVPSGPGTLILMNHQSVLDIPLLVSTVEGGYPRIVTRERYRRFVPLISHLVRLYQYPTVDPTANPKEMLRSIRSMVQASRESDVPIGLFPEGTRTKDGSIGRFKPRGLAKLLAARSWTVYVFVVDGYWQTAKVKHFLAGMGHVNGRIAHVKTMEWSDPTADSTAFIEEVYATMVQGVAELREEEAVS